MSDNQGWSLFGFQIKRRPQPDSIRSFTPEIKDIYREAIKEIYGNYK